MEQNSSNNQPDTARRAAARWAWVVVTLGAAAAAFFMGHRLGVQADGEKPVASASGEAATMWTCAMHPEIRQSAPGKCPICGMDLIPAAASSTAAAPAAPTKYACAMMCIPPQDQGGKCPVCGMEMVAVELSGGGGGADGVTLSEAALRLAGVETAAVERRFVDHEIRLVGMVDFDETRQRSIAARVPGRLDRLYVDYTGITVAPGDHLVSVYSPDLLTAQEELLQAIKGVVEGEQAGIAALKEIAEENVRIVKTKMRLWGLTEEQIQEIIERGTVSDHITIFAPIGGVVIKKDAVQGMYVTEGMALYTIADLSQVWVQLKAYESDLVWVRYGQAIAFEAEAYPGETFTGTIAFISPLVDAGTRTVDVRANVGNANLHLKPGMFVRAKVQARLAAGGKVIDPALAGKFMCPMHPEVVREEGGECDRCGMTLVTTEALGYAAADPAAATAPLVIPVSAPLITGRRAIVYLADAHAAGTFTMREITLGPRAGAHYLVQEGLTEGERVVARGALRMDSAAQILGRASMMTPSHEEHGEPGGDGAKGIGGQVERLEAPKAFLERLDPVFEAYFVVQDALSHDRWEEARAAAGTFEAKVRALGDLGAAGAAGAAWKEDYKALMERAGRLAAAGEIKALRVAYQPVSNLLITAAQRYGTSGRFAVRRYHCPMAFDNRGADWLQNRSGVENPYFGAEMFSCGVLREVIAEGPDEEGQP